MVGNRINPPEMQKKLFKGMDLGNNTILILLKPEGVRALNRTQIGLHPK